MLFRSDLRDTSLRTRNWDDDLRNEQQEADGVVAEVIFPNTVPPFFPSFVLFAPPPTAEEYELRLAGIRAHNRWLVDFCKDYPEQRAGIGQIFVNNLDDAMADTQWIVDHGLRGGLLLPNVPPDAHWVEHHLFDPYWEPLWDLCEETGVVVNAHGGTGRRHAAAEQARDDDDPAHHAPALSASGRRGSRGAGARDRKSTRLNSSHRT